MSEWPKTPQDAFEDGNVMEVIPADLAQQLYEALKRVKAEWISVECWREVDDAIARFEREVGK